MRWEKIYKKRNCLLFCLDNWLKKVHRLCPYLDTINRQVLDFDFEKLCSVSLSRINVYACLVCGKYFQGNINICVLWSCMCVYSWTRSNWTNYYGNKNIIKYNSNSFTGRGTNTHAYTHSVAESHHVFLNLQTLKFYCLPDNYEIVGQYFSG